MSQPCSIPLSTQQRAIAPIAAFAATGELARLRGALAQGLDAGLSVAEIKEVLVQVYAYAGFPRSLNALGEFMQVLQSRRQQGMEDEAGRTPGQPIPTGEALLAVGTANQTRLAGAPVQGPVFEFAPAIDAYLKTHLFGDIFERDNLDWQSREVATVAMLSSLVGTDAQLKAHVRISLNVGVSTDHLRELAQVLQAQVGEEAAQRTRAALSE